ncbi:hypothetical protein SPRG_19299 [Saprolegnia parasitica CBS 223.65]|uniref:VPS37 C-terminal domain-containing protein n=1 Tax=Saprolegnia parasitica (strain CBS 223.65) TaxID=695850 RepID=A0A067D4T4_SAPPC|nr:hypothetical protein SPRG_19299 [Saprolegnia parasitica CBS 223.65]KDO33686.1 hypothetical protein SPRG_19299 [Saprolegnia parasitica CBS 223.65]|eukprot:XP_012195712.1 hypothetical protein SPRG_19299 [Saprolegnia parasitica CBS 223.65]
MSFFFGKAPPKPAPPVHTGASSELMRLRGRQIASLVRAGGQAINHEQSIFDVVVRLADARSLTLRISLPDEFPMQAPLIQTTSRVQHSWLDAQCRVVGHIDLASWGVHADLGRIVNDILSEFQRNPPVVAGRVTSTPPPAYHAPVSPAYTQPFYPSSSGAASYATPYNNNTSQSSSYTREKTPPPLKARDPYMHTQTPAIPTSFPELDELSITQLEKLVSDRQALKAYIRNMDAVINFMKLYDDLVKGNAELAEKNLSYEGTLATLQMDIQSLKSQVQAAQEVLSLKQVRQQEILSRVRGDVLVARVTQAADEVDEATEDIGSRFTNGEMDVSQFLAEFLPSRKLYHQRMAKVERFNQQQQ